MRWSATGRTEPNAANRPAGSAGARAGTHFHLAGCGAEGERTPKCGQAAEQDHLSDESFGCFRFLLQELLNEAVALRGLFLIDKNGVVRHQIVNDFPLGRSVDEAIRMVDSLQHFEEFGEVCPADWHKGDKAMKETAASVAEYLGSK